MQIEEILKLDKTASSLVVIASFLEKTPIFSDYVNGYLYSLEIRNTLGDYKSVILGGEKLLSKIPKDNSFYIAALDKIIYALIATKDHILLEHYLKLKKAVLPILDQYKAILDEIEYRKIIKKPYEDLIDYLLSDVIPIDVKNKLLGEKFLFKYQSQNYLEASAILDLIKKENYFNQFYAEELKILIALNKTEDAKKLATKNLFKDYEGVASFLALLTIYENEENYHKISILDADFEFKIEMASLVQKSEAYLKLHQIYQKIGNKLSSDIYLKKYKQVLKLQEKPSKEIIIKTPSIKENNQEDKTIIKEPKLFENDLDDLFKLIVFSHQIDSKLQFREKLRLIFNEVSQKIPFNEAILYLKSLDKNLYHYKKERLYDKKITDEELKDTVILSAMLLNDKIIVGEGVLSLKKNLATSKDYDLSIKTVFAISVYDIGVVIFHFDCLNTQNDLYYAFLKIVSAIIYDLVRDYKEFTKEREQKELLEAIFNSEIFKVRVQTKELAHYNKYSQDLLSLRENSSLEQFYENIANKDLASYKDFIAQMFVSNNSAQTIKYLYLNKFIKEEVISFSLNGICYLVSIFQDISQEIAEKSKLEEKVYLDNDTNIKNRYAFKEKFSNYLEEKVSFILISLDNDIKSIYSNHQVKEYFKEFTKISSSFFLDLDLYLYSQNTILVVFNFNDIRTVTKKVKDYLYTISEYKATSIAHEKFATSIGILRYPVSSEEKNHEKLFHFFDIGLLKAQKNLIDRFEFFSYSDYEEELFEQKVIDEINNSFDNENFGLSFLQITDIEKNRIWQYESFLTIPNLAIDSKYLKIIAKKRNRLLELEKKHLELVIKFLSKLKINASKQVKVTIPISGSSLLDLTFSQFLLKILKDYDISPSYLKLKIDDDIKNAKFETIIAELRDMGISFETSNLNIVLNHLFSTYHFELLRVSDRILNYIAKLKDFLDKNAIVLVLRGVNSKESKEMLAKSGVKYLEGSIYKAINEETLIDKILRS